MTAPTARPKTVAFLITLGMLLIIGLRYDAEPKVREFLLLLIVPAALFIKPVPRTVKQLDLWLAGLNPRSYLMFLLACGTAAFAGFVGRALLLDYPLFPLLHDEYMSLLQSRMLLSGHVALPPHALPSFFDTFYVIVKPVYASMYFPGTALAYVPALALGLPSWVWATLITSAAVVMVQVNGTLLLRNRLLGLAAAIGFAGINAMLFLPTMAMSHPLAALLGMILIFAYWRWRDTASMAMALLAGAMAGWLLITRPPEGIAYGVPVAVAVLASARSLPWRRWTVAVALAVAAAMPFGLLILAHNYRVTGSVTYLPINFYVDQEFKGVTSFGVGTSADQLQSNSELLQKQVMFQKFVRPLHTASAGRTTFEQARIRYDEMLGSSVPWIILSVGILLSLPLLKRDAGMRLAWSTLGLFLILVPSYPSYLAQYSIPIAPVALIVLLGGANYLAESWPTRAARVRAIYLTAIAAGAVLRLITPGPHPAVGRETGVISVLRHQIASQTQGRALIFVKFHSDESPHVEVVYNIDAARIDDNRIVFAHDLGNDRNQALIRYYATTQPDRKVYFFDRKSFTLTSSETVREAAEQSTSDGVPNRGRSESTH